MSGVQLNVGLVKCMGQSKPPAPVASLASRQTAWQGFLIFDPMVSFLRLPLGSFLGLSESVALLIGRIYALLDEHKRLQVVAKPRGTNSWWMQASFPQKKERGSRMAMVQLFRGTS